MAVRKIQKMNKKYWGYLIPRGRRPHKIHSSQSGKKIEKGLRAFAIFNQT